MKIHRVEAPGLAHYSYVLSSQGRCAVIDAKRDVDTYFEYARASQLEITQVLETHIHADYASGARELSERTGAELWLSGHDSGELFEYAFAHREFRDGEFLTLGDVRIEALHTPGHTPEHISLLVTDFSRGNYPAVLFSGDFVFAGSLGRPDLLGEDAKRHLASALFDSIARKTAGLPDGVEIRPAHGAGSLCGSGMSERPQSTLGYERHSNPFFGICQRESFISRILDTAPPFPDYYRRMKRLNAQGPALLGRLPGARAFSPAEFRERLEDGDAAIVDLRRSEAFGGAHIPGAINLGAGPAFGFWAGWVVPYERGIYLVGDEESTLEDTRRALIRVGLDGIEGFLEGGMRAWIESGYEHCGVAQTSVSELHEKLPQRPFVLDVRSEAEWQCGHIEAAHHVYAGEITQRLPEIPRDRRIHVICGTGYRSSMAASVLLREGYRDLVNVIGGMTAWNAAELPVTAPADRCAA